jgi:hypothetical protein
MSPTLAVLSCLSAVLAANTGKALDAIACLWLAVVTLHTGVVCLQVLHPL